MKLGIKLKDFRRQLVSGQLPEEKPVLAQYIGWALNAVMGFILSTVSVFDGCGPFGIAITAQAGAQVGGLLCTLGASIGYLITFGFEKGIKYVAAIVLIFTASYVFQELKIYKRQWFMPLIAAAFTLLTGFLGKIDGSNSVPVMLPIITETVLAGGCTYFFREAFSVIERESDSAELRHGIAVIILLACLMMALTAISFAGVVSLGRLAAMLIVMTAAYKGGALSGAAAGTALGIAMDVCSAGTPFYTMAYSFAGMISGVFSKHSRIIFLISCILSNTITVILTSASGLREDVLYEMFAASVIFMILPSSFYNYLGAFLRQNQASSGESGLRKYTAKRIGRVSDALKDLYATVDNTLSKEANDDDISRIFNRASDVICSKCKNKSLCWNSMYMDTLSVFNDLTPIISSRGRILKSDFPEHFTEKCQRSGELVDAINAELRGQMYRRQFKNRLNENRSAAYSQYFDMSEILENVSYELQNSYGPDGLAQRRLGRYLSGMNIDAEISAFRDKCGRLHILIESVRLKSLLEDEGYLDKLSAIVGVRLCRTNASDDAEGRVLLLEAEPYAVSVGIASMKKKGESVSGDRGTYFKTDQGTLCIILSDGMGSGESAAKESVAAVRILERFLRAGVDPAVAMRMLNSMMLLKNGDEWGFATVDLMCVDLFTGDTAFYKYGAAPSYVRSGKTVRRIRCESLAAGLTAGKDSAPDVVRMKLRPGCTALIASDGVLAETNDAWIRAMIAGTGINDMKALARDTLQAALKQYGCSDDMTVLAVRIENRG